MKIKKLLTALVVSFTLIFNGSSAVYATAGTEPLQVYFTEDGKTMKIFTSESLDSNASILIGNETLDAEIKNSDVKINTIFLIDNSTSMPYGLRSEIKTAINDYVSVMPKSESVKIATFDKEVNILADEYSNDSEFIDFELSKIDFQGQASLVYDAILTALETTDTSKDIYYRTVLITDGVDSIEGTSFDYLRSAISADSRYHIDVVQVSDGKKEDVNLTAISNLGSNTFMMFNSGAKFDSIVPEKVSFMKVKLINEVTTGELKGVTIKNGNSNISLGSIMFPQVEIETPTTEAPEETTITTATEAETKAITTKATTEKVEESKNSSIPVLLFIFAGIVVVSGAVGFFVLSKSKSSEKSKNKNNCTVSVNITKDDSRDTNDIGAFSWSFDTGADFKVGRTKNPISNDNTPLPTNDFAICENATNDDINSIGRNAFSLRISNNALIITNIAGTAMFSVINSEGQYDLASGQYMQIVVGDRILLGNYTTITINNIAVN